MRVTLFLAAALMLGSPPSWALFCGPYATIGKTLAEGKYHEHPIAKALAAEGKVAVVLFASEQGETWTIVSITSDQIACVGASATDWQAVARRPALPGKAS
jgi:hypothetical protein